MENTFDLRKFLSENKLTPGTKRLLNEETSFENPMGEEAPLDEKVDGCMIDGKKVNHDSIEAVSSEWDGIDATYAEFEDGTPLDDDQLTQLSENPDYQDLLAMQATDQSDSGKIYEDEDYDSPSWDDVQSDWDKGGHEEEPLHPALAAIGNAGQKTMDVLNNAIEIVANALGITNDDAKELIKKNASRETLESYINEETAKVKEGNAFTKKLADTRKGGKFKLGSKELKDTSNYDKKVEEAKKKKKPSAGLTAKQKSTIAKKARAGKDIGKKGKGFEKVAKAAGGGEKGQKIAASAMWKGVKRK